MRVGLHITPGLIRRRYDQGLDSIVRLIGDLEAEIEDLRMLKLQQKIAGCFRTIEGVQTFCRVRSYLSSARKQSRSLLAALESALKGKPIALTG